MVALWIAGVGVFLAGLMAIGFGIPTKEFSFGNTMILSGTIAACTGILLLGFGVVTRELRKLAEMQAFPATERPPYPDATDAAPAPWLEEAASRNARPPRSAPAEPPPVRSPEPEALPLPEPVVADETPKPRQRRNLLFASLKRKDEESAGADASAEPAPAQADPYPAETQPSLDETWPSAPAERPRERDSSLLRRSSPSRPVAPPPPAEPPPAPPEPRYPPRPAEAPPITVLKSGVVDGMAYSLYSDGSIEAQMPEGMIRFASIDALRAHLDQRGG